MLSKLVDFYRLIGKPCIDEHYKFEQTIVLDNRQHQLLLAIQQSSQLGRLEELSDSSELFELDEINASHYGQQFKIIYQISTGGLHFYRTLDDLLLRNKGLSRGDLIKEFYVAEDDYLFGELHVTAASPKYDNLKKVVQLIHELKDLAHYHDAKAGQEYLNLVFVSGADGSPTNPLRLSPRLDTIALDGLAMDIEPIKKLGDSAGVNPHIEREKAVFRASLLEFLNPSSGDAYERFAALVSGWEEFLVLFKRNYDTYISGFAFHKARKEVADAEVQAADQLSKVLNDISGKMLGIPLSLAALPLLQKSDSTLERLVLVLATLVTAWMLAEVMHNQQLQLARLKHARALIFDELANKAKTYPSELASKLKVATTELQNNERKLTRLLKWLRIGSWVPALLASALLLALSEYNAVVLIVSFVISVLVGASMKYLQHKKTSSKEVESKG